MNMQTAAVSPAKLADPQEIFTCRQCRRSVEGASEGIRAAVSVLCVVAELHVRDVEIEPAEVRIVLEKVRDIVGVPVCRTRVAAAEMDGDGLLVEVEERTMRVGQTAPDGVEVVPRLVPDRNERRLAVAQDRHPLAFALGDVISERLGIERDEGRPVAHVVRSRASAFDTPAAGRPVAERPACRIPVAAVLTVRCLRRRRLEAHRVIGIRRELHGLRDDVDRDVRPLPVAHDVQSLRILFANPVRQRLTPPDKALLDTGRPKELVLRVFGLAEGAVVTIPLPGAVNGRHQVARGVARDRPLEPERRDVHRPAVRTEPELQLAESVKPKVGASPHDEIADTSLRSQDDPVVLRLDEPRTLPFDRFAVQLEARRFRQHLLAAADDARRQDAAVETIGPVVDRIDAIRTDPDRRPRRRHRSVDARAGLEKRHVRDMEPGLRDDLRLGHLGHDVVRLTFDELVPELQFRRRLRRRKGDFGRTDRQTGLPTDKLQDRGNVRPALHFDGPEIEIDAQFRLPRQTAVRESHLLLLRSDRLVKLRVRTHETVVVKDLLRRQLAPPDLQPVIGRLTSVHGRIEALLSIERHQARIERTRQVQRRIELCLRRKPPVDVDRHGVRIPRHVKLVPVPRPPVGLSAGELRDLAAAQVEERDIRTLGVLVDVELEARRGRREEYLERLHVRKRIVAGLHPERHRATIGTKVADERIGDELGIRE